MVAITVTCDTLEWFHKFASTLKNNCYNIRMHMFIVSLTTVLTISIWLLLLIFVPQNFIYSTKTLLLIEFLFGYWVEYLVIVKFTLWDSMVIVHQTIVNMC